MKTNALGHAAVAVHGLARKSERFVLLIAEVLTLAPLLFLEIAVEPSNRAVLTLQVLWGTFCFIVPPVVHARCRMVVWLEGCLDEQEARQPQRERGDAA